MNIDELNQIQDTFLDYVLNPLAVAKDSADEAEKAQINAVIDEMIRELRDLKKQ